jgi:GTPase SAR1 family protein
MDYKYPTIKPPPAEQKEGISTLKYPDILEASFCWLVVGKPGSGKTYFIE